jgi:autotransporter translocation and assembly factor TamB
VRGAATLDEAGFVADDSFWLYSGTLTLDPRLAVHRGDAAAVVAAPALPPWHRDLDIGLELDLSRSTSVQVEMPLDDAYGALEASLASILLDARLDGRLEASYRSGALGLTGEVQPVWGRADILGARFSLSEGGTIVFLGDDPFDPALQLAAVHDAGRWGEVGVDIGGTLGDMTLAFHSDDYPDETDIVSILLLGSPASELSSAQSQSNAGLMSAASSVLFGEIERRGASGRLLDMIELGGGVYKAGRAIGDDLFVTLAVNPEAQGEEGENVTEVKVDWTISRAWSAEFVTGDQGSGSADIFWSLRF